jgi:hypothetical protein
MALAAGIGERSSGSFQTVPHPHVIRPMNNPYTREWLLPFRDGQKIELFSDLETVLRVGPQWDVKSLKIEGPVARDSNFSLDIEYDRTEAPVSFAGKVKEFTAGKALRILMQAQEHTVDFSVNLSDHPGGTLIAFHISAVPPPVIEDLREYDMWARSFVNYVKISASRKPLTRIWKWFLDRWWLRMTQSGKRMVFFIVVADGFSVVFLAAVLLWWKYFSGP